MDGRRDGPVESAQLTEGFALAGLDALVAVDDHAYEQLPAVSGE